MHMDDILIFRLGVVLQWLAGVDEGGNAAHVAGTAGRGVSI